jgi:hypothetical protein
MEIMHKHKGCVRSDTGEPRNHKVSVQHKDRYAKQCHTLQLATIARMSKKPISKKPISKKTVSKKPISKKTVSKKPTNAVALRIDNEGYLTIDLDSVKTVKGIKLTFTRREGRTKKQVALKIKNDPCVIKKGEKITSKKKLVIDREY